jgi:hypothetical protein
VRRSRRLAAGHSLSDALRRGEDALSVRQYPAAVEALRAALDEESVERQDRVLLLMLLTPLLLARAPERVNDFETVALTNRVADPATILAFHNGRGAQEGTFAELKTDLPMGYLPSRRQVGNQVWLLSAVLAHALARELQMAATPPRHERNTPAREPLWLIERVDTLRKWWIQRAARTTRHAGRLVITFAKGGDTESEIRRLLEPWGRAAA